MKHQESPFHTTIIHATPRVITKHHENQRITMKKHVEQLSPQLAFTGVADDHKGGHRGDKWPLGRQAPIGMAMRHLNNKDSSGRQVLIRVTEGYDGTRQGDKCSLGRQASTSRHHGAQRYTRGDHEAPRYLTSHLETPRDIRSHFETLPDTPRHFETFRDTPRHFETFRHTT